MADQIKLTVAQNIASLRKDASLTQAELAEKLNYSDKAISKWERGLSLPDVLTLKTIADEFGVTVDYLITSHGNESKTETIPQKKRLIKNRKFICAMSIVLVWLIATFAYMLSLFFDFYEKSWLAFIYAVPVSFIVWLVLSSVWFDKKLNFLIISLLMWSALASVLVSLYVFGCNGWPASLLGVPGQIIIILWSRIRKH